MEFIWILLIILFASFIQGMTSFGSSLIALPLLLMFLDVKEVVPMMAMLNLVMNANIYREVGKDADMKRVGPLVVTAVIFSIVGAFLLVSLNETPIKIIVGSMMFITAVTKLLGWQFKIKKPERLFVPVGIISGVLNGTTGMSGPPVLLFLSSLDVPKKVFRSTLTTYFLTLNVVAITMFIVNGIITWDIFMQTAIYMIPMLIGTQIGVIAGRRIHDERFKKIVLFMMLLMSINLLVRTL